MSNVSEDKPRQLTAERIKQIRNLSQTQKVEAILLQEWEAVELCDIALGAARAVSVLSISGRNEEELQDIIAGAYAALGDAPLSSCAAPTAEALKAAQEWKAGVSSNDIDFNAMAHYILGRSAVSYTPAVDELLSAVPVLPPRLSDQMADDAYGLYHNLKESGLDRRAVIRRLINGILEQRTAGTKRWIEEAVKALKASVPESAPVRGFGKPMPGDPDDLSTPAVREPVSASTDTKDAVRYRWLRDKFGSLHSMDPECQYPAEASIDWHWEQRAESVSHPGSIDSLIDDQMARSATEVHKA